MLSRKPRIKNWRVKSPRRRVPGANELTISDPAAKAGSLGLRETERREISGSPADSWRGYDGEGARVLMGGRFLPPPPNPALQRAHPAPPLLDAEKRNGRKRRRGEGRGVEAAAVYGGRLVSPRLAGAEVLGWGKGWGNPARRAVLSRRWREEAWQLARSFDVS